MPEDAEGIARIKGQVLRNFIHIGEPVTKDTLIIEPTKEEIINSIKGKNLTVMCGGGKDSEFVLAIARVTQLMILEEYGVTFKLRVGVGRQPGMIDVYDNLENCFHALGLKGDVLADIFYIDGKQTRPYDKNYPIPENVVKMNRDNVLMNGHVFSGAGRRTFCDDCNKMLSGWIATGLAYDGGADLFMTGDSRKELRAQIGTAVPKMAMAFGITLPNGRNLSPTQHALTMLKAVGDEHSRQIHGNSEKEIESRSIDAQHIPDRTRFVSIFPTMEYESKSKNRLQFLTNFLGFGFDSLMFSFTESDCGNPALMCHLYGLVAEQAYGNKGATYSDGIRMYVEYAIGKMEEKGFSDALIQSMRERYKDENAISYMHEKVEQYAERAYGLKPEHLTAMVYAPFTQGGTNLHRYLEHLVESKYPNARALLASESRIREQLSDASPLAEREAVLVRSLENATGLTLTQMRRLHSIGLAINNFNQAHESNNVTETLRKTMDMDIMYLGAGTLHAGKQLIQLQIRGR